METQAKELLYDMYMGKATLSEEQLKEVVDLGLSTELEKAQKRVEARKKEEKANKILDDFYRLIDRSKDNGFVEIPKEKVEEIKKEWAENNQYSVDTYDPITRAYNNYEFHRQDASKFKWLMDYKGSNSIVLDIRSRLKQWSEISSAQESYAKSLIDQENGVVDEEITKALEYLIKNKANGFIQSLAQQFAIRKSLSPKQKFALMNAYKKAVK